MRSCYVVVVCTLAFVAGCETGTSLQDVTTPPIKPSEAEVSVQIASWEDVQAWIGEHRGKVVVVDLWSTYCPPCKREFPHFVSLHEQNNEHVVCVSLSLDFYGGGGDPADAKPNVEQFLASQNATMKNFVSSTPDSDVLKAVGASAVPVALVYDQAGNLHKVFSNDSDEYGDDGFTYEKDIEPLVQSLLKS